MRCRGALAPGATAGAWPSAAPESSWSSATALHGPDVLRPAAAHARGGQDDEQRDGVANGYKKVQAVSGEQVGVAMVLVTSLIENVLLGKLLRSRVGSGDVERLRNIP